jgi:hypothetical protein
MFEQLMKYLSRIGINYEILDDNKGLDFKINGQAGSWNCMFSVHEKMGVGIYSTLLKPVPKSKQTQMVMFLMYLNNNHLFGNFEFDFKTGDVRFKTYLDCLAQPLTDKSIDAAMVCNVKTMQYYLPQIMNIIQAA